MLSSFLFLVLFLAVSNASFINNTDIDIENVAKLMKNKSQEQKQGLKLHNLGEFCMFECDNGAKAKQNPNSQFNVNGCGSYNFHIDFVMFNMREFDDCCNVHDRCYEKCNTKKNSCDTSFNQCLTNVCFKWKREKQWGFIKTHACKAIVKMMDNAVRLLGCTAYKNGQKNGCTCEL